MLRRFVLWLTVAGSLALAGCASVSTGGGVQTAERPMLDADPVTDAQRRSKVHVDLGMAYFEVGRYDLALEAARNALAHEPSYPPAHHLMGLVLMTVGDSGAARESFLRALRAAPNDPDFNNSYGWFLCSIGEEQEGLRHLALAATNPYYRYATRPYANSGLCHLRLKNEDAARVQFQLAVTVDPNNALALYHLAGIAYRRGDYATARSHLVQLHQRRDPTAESAWLGLRTERRLGNQEAAASYAEQLRGRFSDSPQYQEMIQGRFE